MDDEWMIFNQLFGVLLRLYLWNKPKFSYIWGAAGITKATSSMSDVCGSILLVTMLHWNNATPEHPDKTPKQWKEQKFYLGKKSSSQISRSSKYSTPERTCLSRENVLRSDTIPEQFYMEKRGWYGWWQAIVAIVVGDGRWRTKDKKLQKSFRPRKEREKCMFCKAGSLITQRLVNVARNNGIV